MGPGDILTCNGAQVGVAQDKGVHSHQRVATGLNVPSTLPVDFSYCGGSIDLFYFFVVFVSRMPNWQNRYLNASINFQLIQTCDSFSL